MYLLLIKLFCFLVFFYSDPHELEGVRASALNASPSRIPQPGAQLFGGQQDGGARPQRTGSLDLGRVPPGSPVGQARLRRLGDARPSSPEPTIGSVGNQIPTPKKTPKKIPPSTPTKPATPVKLKSKIPTAASETRTIAIQTDLAKQNEGSPKTPRRDIEIPRRDIEIPLHSPQRHSPQRRSLQTQFSVEETSSQDRRFSIDSVKLVRACSIAAESPSLLADNLGRGSSWGLTAQSRNQRSFAKRDKSLKQRREDERQVQRSRLLSNPYELSVDLYNKQVRISKSRSGYASSHLKKDYTLSHPENDVTSLSAPNDTRCKTHTL